MPARARCTQVWVASAGSLAGQPFGVAHVAGFADGGDEEEKVFRVGHGG